MDQGRLQGRGRYLSKTGERIEAPFVDGRAQGIGTYVFANGDRYEGEISAGVLSGQGVYHYKSGLRYEGEVRQGHARAALESIRAAEGLSGNVGEVVGRALDG